MNRQPLLRVCNLHRGYGAGPRRVDVLRGVDLCLYAGQVVALRGPSGSGKTTLLNSIAGLDNPEAGQVWLDEQELTATSERERAHLRRRQIGIVFQAQALLPTYSAAENVDLLLRLAGVPRAERRQRVSGALQAVGLQEWAGHRPNELSGGQQQRIAIARVLAQRPALVLADEPTGELDTETGAEMIMRLRALARERPAAVLIASHDDAVAAAADVVYALQDGQVREAVAALSGAPAPVPL